MGRKLGRPGAYLHGGALSEKKKYGVGDGRARASPAIFFFFFFPLSAALLLAPLLFCAPPRPPSSLPLTPSLSLSLVSRLSLFISPCRDRITCTFVLMNDPGGNSRAQVRN